MCVLLGCLDGTENYSIEFYDSNVRLGEKISNIKRTIHLFFPPVFVPKNNLNKNHDYIELPEKMYKIMFTTNIPKPCVNVCKCKFSSSFELEHQNVHLQSASFQKCN